MQQAAELDSSPAGFAGLLAALTAARQQKPQSWAANLDELQDDVAVLSYESALRHHARYRPAQQYSWPSKDGEEIDLAATAQAPASAVASQPEGAAQAGASAPSAAGLERSRKRASVTLRMSKAECTQLQQRAAEAGLTVSAYLRSCTFEVEGLRAQVKQALADLRAAQAAQNQRPRPAWRWLRFFAARRRSRDCRR